MKILREEKPEGTLVRLIFHADESEDLPTLKQEVKTWIAANLPMSWEEFFLDSQRIILDMDMS